MGAEISVDDQTMEIRPGMDLSGGGMVETNASSLVVARTNGSRVKVDPGSRVEITSSGINIVQGSATVNAPMGAQFDVGSEIGVVEGIGATFGVSLNLSGDMATLKISNASGTVNFTADIGLDTSGTTVTMVEPGKQTSVAPGDSLTVRVVARPETGELALVPEGAIVEAISPEVTEEITQTGDEISQISVPTPPDEVPGETPVTDPEDVNEVIIPLPIEDVEVASDPG
ncbi:MAG: hypothetical protein GVY10_11375 [Verrucomicrobia bacterium]|nr:hypothetical protein [Verrucomicrobiota bacterium]